MKAIVTGNRRYEVVRIGPLRHLDRMRIAAERRSGAFCLPQIGRVMLRLAGSLVITAIFVVGVEYVIGWEALLRPWRVLDDAVGICVAIGLIGMTYVMRAVRLYHYFGLRSRFGSCVRLQLYHLALVNLLPFRSGELAFPVLMRRYFEISLPASIGGLLWLRALDLHVLVMVVVAFVGTIFFGPLVAIAGVLLWLASLVVVPLCLRGALRIADGTLRSVHRMLLYAESSSPRTRKRLIQTWTLTLLNWGLKILTLAWIFRLFVAESNWYSIVAVTAGELSAILPIQGIGGFGTYEAAILAAMAMSTVAPEAALVGAVNVHLFTLGTSILAALTTLLLSSGSSLFRFRFGRTADRRRELPNDQTAMARRATRRESDSSRNRRPRILEPVSRRSQSH